MKKNCIYLATVLLLASLIQARIHEVRGLAELDDATSGQHHIAIVFAYTQPERKEREERTALHEAQRAFNDVSNQKIYKEVAVQFIKVDLAKTDSFMEKHHLAQDSHTAWIIIFKNGKSLKTQKIILEQKDHSDFYDALKNVIDDTCGDYIQQLLDDKKEHERALETTRAQAPRYYYYSDPYYYDDPWYYGPGWGYGYYGYGHRGGWHGGYHGGYHGGGFHGGGHGGRR